RRQVKRRPGVGEQPLERAPPLGLRRREQAPAAAGEQVERDERGGRLARELLDSGLRRMQAQLQRVEVEAVRSGDHDLAVEHGAFGQSLEKQRVQLREVAVERLLVTTLNEHVVVAAEDERAEAVPLGL